MTVTLDDAPAFVAPTDNLIRTASFRAEPSDDGLTLEGYAAVFGARTLIDSWEGRFEEEIAPGAFKRSIGDKTPILQFDHGKHPLIGSIPIGVIKSIREDGHGLKIRARLSDNWLVEPVRDAIRDGAVTGMSFRFRVASNGEKWTNRHADTPVRTLTDLDLFEVGPVVWPAYEQTSVGVRSREVASALADPEVRHEVARLLFSGADLRSLADADALPSGRVSDPDALPESGRAEEPPQPTGDFRARLLLAFADL